MKTHLLKTTSLCAVLLGSGLVSAQAQTITNADAAVNLNLSGSWVGGIVPGAANVAVWDATVQNNLTKALGGNLSWAGIQVLNPGNLVTISSGSTLTLGASGIDLSQATNGLTISAAVALGANQTWLATNGMTLNVGGGISGAGMLLTLNNGGNNNGTIILPLASTYSGGTVINSGFVEPYVITSFGTGEITNNGGDILLNNFTHGGIMTNPWFVTGTSMIDMNNQGQSFVLNGAWSGTGNILVTNLTSSGATLTFGGASSSANMANFTGSIIVATNASGTASAGTIRFNNGGALDNAGNSLMSINLGTNSTVEMAQRDSGATAIGELTGGPGTTLKGSTGAANGTTTWSIGGKNTSVTFAGNIMNNAANEFSALTKVGTGTFTLTGNNTFTGPLTISAGVLQIGDGGADGILVGGTIINNASLVFNRSDNLTVITNNISGTGSLIIQAGGTDTLNGIDTSSGPTIVSQGDLILGASGSIAGPISVAAGSTFDASQNSTFTLNQTLSGSGSVNGSLTAVGGTISPGLSGSSGTLTFLSNLTESGGINNQFTLSTPGGTNDLINVDGELTLTGTNYILLNDFGGGTIPVGTYPLFAYSGTLSGGTTNFIVTAVGVTGTLTNLANLTPPELAVIISPTARGATNLVWKGDGGANIWDLITSNWVNGATSFNFQTGDRVIFNDSGVPNTTVAVALAVLPGSVLVSNTQPYTFDGVGGINGTTGLIKTDTGLLSMAVTNGYTGPTVVSGGILQAFNVANGGSPSSIGAAISNPTNLVFFSSTFAYAGPSAATDRGATLNGTGVTFDVINGTTLTLNGTLNGSGALTLVDSGTLSLGSADNYTGGTVLSNGVLAAANQTANLSGFGPTTSPITFYGGTFTLFNSTHDDGSTAFSFSNPLVVPAGQTGTLNIFERGDENGILTGGGTLNISALGQRGGFAGNWSAFTGILNITGNFRIENTYGYSNTVIYLNAAADLDGGTSAGVYSSNPTFSIGELDGASTATIGAVTKPTPYPIWQVGWLNTTSVFAGTIENPTGGAGSITKVGTGIWYLSGQNTYTGTTAIEDGVLALTNNISTGSDGSIGGSTNIIIGAGAVLDVSGTLNDNDSFYVGGSQVLCGYGTLRGILDTTQGGTVSGGGGIAGGVGTLTATNNINLGGVAWMKLNRASSPNSDKLVSSTAGTISYGGTLVVTNIGAALQVGDTFTLFSAPTLQNSFGTVVLPNYYTWDTSQLTVSGKVSVTGMSALLPSFGGVDFSQLANGTVTLNASNGAPNGPVTVLSTTNLALPLSNWTTIFSGNFDGNGNLSDAITVDPTAPQEYYLLEAE